ncbi:MAG TPA: hypothetical protein VFD93_04695 [Candidatus Acidoferrales bacterium]|nr:hypothetical protein [Candidatus Acidoferrales bacterium]
MKRRTSCAFDVARLLVIACGLAACFPQLAASAHGAVALGQISVKGEATINGVNAIGGASVFSGDRVATRKGATASVSMKDGDELILGELTSVEVEDARSEITVPLDSGQLEYLSGPELPIVVSAGGTQIVPQGRGGVYAVALQGDTLRVTARKGFAKLKSANSEVEIAEGKTLVATIGTLQQEGQKPPNGSEAKGSSGHIVNYVIIAAGVAGGAGLALALVHANSGCAVSPSNVGNCASPH